MMILNTWVILILIFGIHELNDSAKFNGIDFMNES